MNFNIKYPPLVEQAYNNKFLNARAIEGRWFNEGY